MMFSRQAYNSRGFTLIEVTVALAILAWVMGGAVYMVNQYADERAALRERFYASQVAWNQLMEEYRYANELAAQAESQARPDAGEEIQGQNIWLWEVEVTPALGRSLYQYRVYAGPGGSEGPTLSRSMYLVRER